MESVFSPTGRAATVLGLVANLVGVLSFIVTLIVFGAGSRSVSEVTISLFAAALLILLVAWAWVIARKERYANVTKYTELVSERARQSRSRLNDSIDPLNPQSAFREDIEAILTDIATIYGIVTGTYCRCTLKVLRLDGDEPYVVAFARDRNSARVNSNADKIREDTRFDKLSLNPHLRNLFANSVDGEDFDCFQDVRSMVASGKYVSSSILWQLEGKGTQTSARPLPYRSALLALVKKSDDSNIGFLGIDSGSRGVFRPAWDGPLLVALANAIAPAFEALLDHPSVAANPPNQGSATPVAPATGKPI